MTHREKLREQKDKIIPLFVESIKAKIRYWKSVRAVERMLCMIDGSTDEIDDNLIESHAVGCDVEEDADQLTPAELLEALEKMLEDPDGEANP